MASVPVTQLRVAGRRILDSGTPWFGSGANLQIIPAWDLFAGVLGNDGRYLVPFTYSNRRKIFARMAEVGINVIRVPIASDLYYGDADKPGLDVARLGQRHYLSHIDRVTSDANAAGIRVILCVWDALSLGQSLYYNGLGRRNSANDVGGWLEWLPVTLAFMSEVFDAVGDRPGLMWEPFNEPNHTERTGETVEDGWAKWLTATTATLDTMRGWGYTGPVFLDGTHYSFRYSRSHYQAALDHDAGLLGGPAQLVAAPHWYDHGDGLWRTHWLGAGIPDGLMPVVLSEFGDGQAGWGLDGMNAFLDSIPDINASTPSAISGAMYWIWNYGGATSPAYTSLLPEGQAAYANLWGDQREPVDPVQSDSSAFSESFDLGDRQPTYPTAPSQVGLTVAKNGLTVYTTHQTITVDTDVSNSAFTRGLSIGGGAAITGSNVWAYNITGGPGGGGPFRWVTGGGSLTLTQVEIGYDGTTIGLDPLGGVWDPGDYVTTTFSSSRGSIDVEDFLIHYIREGPSLQEYYSRWSNGWIGPFYSIDPADHCDVFQSTGAPNGFLVEKVRAQAEFVEGSVPHSLQWLILEGNNSPVSGGVIRHNFVSWIGVAGINFDGTGDTYPIDLSMYYNTFDSDVGDPTPISSKALFSERYENRWSGDGSLIPEDRTATNGQQEAPMASTPTHVATTSGTTNVLTLPASASTGHLICVDIYCEDAQAVAGTTDITPPAADDWNLINVHDGLHNDSDQASFWRYVKAGDTPGTTTFTFTGASNYVSVLSVYSNTATSSPIVTSSRTTYINNDVTLPMTGVTTTEDNQVVRAAPCTRGGIAGWTAKTPASQNERADLGSGRRLAVYDYVKATAGATGTLEYDAASATVGKMGIAYVIAGAATVPAQPTGASATALSSSSIKVDWTDNASDETGYRVERSPNGSTGWTNVSGSLAANTVTYTDTGLTAGTIYYYRVYATNAVGDGDPSTVVNATTQAAPASSGNRIGGTGAIRRPPRLRGSR